MTNNLAMTPEHPQWLEFVERLEGPEGCDFQEHPEKGFTWKCKGGYDKSFARAILETIPDIDIEASMEHYNKNGGHCDCEILFNVDPYDEEDIEEICVNKTT